MTVVNNSFRFSLRSILLVALFVGCAGVTTDCWDPWVLRWRVHENVTQACFIPGRNLIATASDKDETAYVWSTETGEEMLGLPGHSGGVKTIIASPDGQYLLTCGSDTMTRTWSAQNGSLKCTTALPETFKTLKRDTIEHYFLPDGTALIAGGTRVLSLHCINPENGMELDSIKGAQFPWILSPSTFGNLKYVLKPNRPAEIWYRRSDSEMDTRRNIAVIFACAFFLAMTVSLVRDDSTDKRYWI